MTIKEFESATERVIGGIEKKTVMSLNERKTVAYHEAGHAVAGWFLQHASPLLKVTIIPRSKGALGFAQYLPDEVALYTREKLIDMICVALGGRIAESLYFDSVTTGASDDIKKITNIANSLVTVYGMSDKLRLRSYQSGGESSLKPYSESTNQMIDEEVKSIVDECYARTEKLLEDKKHLIESLAEELLEKESLNLPMIIKILGDRPFEMKESVRDYLNELNTRAVKEEEAKKDEDDKNDKDDGDNSQTAAKADETADDTEILEDTAKPLEDVKVEDLDSEKVEEKVEEKLEGDHGKGEKNEKKE